MVEKGIAEQVPDIAGVPSAKNYGRAFEIAEFERLLEVARTGPERFGLTGYERFLLYILACETGLRRGELRSLTPVSFDFKNNCVFVKGQDTKNGEDAVQLFTHETGQLLQEYLRGKMPSVKVFNIHDKSSKMIQADCEAAEIELTNHKGVLTFHSLRYTCGTYLAAKGVHPKGIQEIMRHKDINLTMGRYTHLLSGQKRAAINRMPRFAKKERRQEKSA